ncbi:TRAP transporter small permease [Halomonas maura]|uniref:TRAP transporter small permease n=1 Tax=Halomonas maura TaxID=117606 RepID=UPI0025B28FB0|nr:TRAP transporter small permease [Halomonas maura]MDN3556544.1 TRAP transporter small permease [Halomonas maura]
MERIRTLLDRSIQAVCCLLFITMVGVASWQVIARYVLNDPSTVSEAFLRFSLVWLSMIAIAYVAGSREHVSLTLLTDRLTGPWKTTFDIFIEILFIAFASVILVFGGFQAASNSMSQIYPMLNVPKGALYSSLPAAGGIIILYCTINCISIYKEYRNQHGHHEIRRQES